MILGIIVAAPIILGSGPIPGRVHAEQRFDRIAECLLWADQTIYKLPARDILPLSAHCLQDHSGGQR